MLLCMKLWNMHRIDQYRGDEEDSDEDEAELEDEYPSDKKPKLHVAYVPHAGAINRSVEL